MPRHIHGEIIHEAITASGPLSQGGANYFVDTTEGAITLTVAADVTNFRVYDSHINFSLNNCTLDFGGGSTKVMNLDGEIMAFFKDANDAWRFISESVGSGGAV